MKRLRMASALAVGLVLTGPPARAVGAVLTRDDYESISLAILVAAAIFLAGVLVAGFVEGMVVSRLFRLPLGRTAVAVIVGNVVLGCAVVTGIVVGEPFRIALGGLATILLDFVFLLRAMPAGPKRGVKAWEATALVQAATYAIMFVVLLSVR